MSLNRTLGALGEGKYYSMYPFSHTKLYVKTHGWFLTLGDENKPSAPGSQHQNQRFTPLPFSFVSFILLSTNFSYAFPCI